MGNFDWSYPSSAFSTLTCRQRDAYPTMHERIVESRIWLEFSDSMRKRMTSWTEGTLPAMDGCSLSNIHLRCRSRLQRKRSGLHEGIGRGVRHSSFHQSLVEQRTSSVLETEPSMPHCAARISRDRLKLSGLSTYGGLHVHNGSIAVRTIEHNSNEFSSNGMSSWKKFPATKTCGQDGNQKKESKKGVIKREKV